MAQASVPPSTRVPSLFHPMLVGIALVVLREVESLFSLVVSEGFMMPEAPIPTLQLASAGQDTSTAAQASHPSKEKDRSLVQHLAERIANKIEIPLVNCEHHNGTTYCCAISFGWMVGGSTIQTMKFPSKTILRFAFHQLTN